MTLNDYSAYRQCLKPVWLLKKHRIIKTQPLWHLCINYIFILLLVLVGLMALQGCSMAYTTDQWANAIYKAENSKNHPYGVMVKYRHTSPRQACINTIRHQWHNYSNLPLKTRQAIDFTTYLGRHYAPIGCINDNGTNKFWVKNVNYWLGKG